MESLFFCAKKEQLLEFCIEVTEKNALHFPKANELFGLQPIGIFLNRPNYLYRLKSSMKV